MPGFDGTGPAGRGSMTGWGKGRCITNAGDQETRSGGPVSRFVRGRFARLGVWGGGMGRGNGPGRGRRSL